MTTIERIDECIAAARKEQSENCDGQAAREFALAITHLEDAAMRFNRGIALKQNEAVGEDAEKLASALGEDAEAVIEAAEGAIHPDQLSLLPKSDQLAENA